MLTKELSPAERVQPYFIEPMQVAPVRELPDRGAWTYEAKLDVYRCSRPTEENGAVLSCIAVRRVSVVTWTFDEAGTR